jgi:hypothetical protein
VFESSTNLLLYDFAQRAIKIVSKENAEINHISLNDYFYSPAFFNDNNILLRWGVTDFENNPNQLIFNVYNYNDAQSVNEYNINNSFGIEDVPFIYKSYEGDFVQNSEFSVYFSYSAGVLFIFDNQKLDFVKKIQTIDKTPPPKAGFIELGGGMKGLINTPAIQPFNDAVLDNENHLFLLNTITDKKTPQ